MHVGKNGWEIIPEYPDLFAVTVYLISSAYNSSVSLIYFGLFNGFLSFVYFHVFLRYIL